MNRDPVHMPHIRLRIPCHIWHLRARRRVDGNNKMHVWIRFMAPVNPASAQALIKSIDHRLGKGMSHLHLMLSCPGGSVFHGLSVHNFLKGTGIEITTYNFGSVDSIGVVLFCSGAHRYCVPSSRFHIHGVKLQIPNMPPMDEKGFEEYIKLLKTDYTNIARVIAATTGRSEKAVVSDMNKQTSLLPEQAKDYGLVHDIRAQLLVSNAPMTVIYEDASVVQFDPVPLQIDFANQPAPVTTVPQAHTAPVAESFTSLPMGFTGEVSSWAK